VAKLGYALRMRYLQKSEGGKVPDVFDAWLLDRDFRDPGRSTLDVRVLLTRDQLSDLHDVLKEVLSRAEEGLLSPQNFLNELKSLAATLSRTPEQLGATTATTAGEGNSLADLGFMREYIEGLPYTGEVMGLSLEDWQSWPTRQQVAFLNRLEEKVNYYRALHDHTDLWVSLDGGPVGGDSVFPVPLEMLP
jgi:serine/threonine-protein kinase PpkA